MQKRLQREAATWSNTMSISTCESSRSWPSSNIESKCLNNKTSVAIRTSQKSTSNICKWWVGATSQLLVTIRPMLILQNSFIPSLTWGATKPITIGASLELARWAQQTILPSLNQMHRHQMTSKANGHTTLLLTYWSRTLTTSSKQRRRLDMAKRISQII